MRTLVPYGTTSPVPTEEKTRSADRLFSLKAIVHLPNTLPHLVEKVG